MMSGATVERPRLHNLSTFTVNGSSRSGKTQFVHHLIRNRKKMFTEDRAPERVLYCYSIWQPSFDDLVKDDDSVELFKGLPSMEAIEGASSPTSELLLVFDDLIYDVINSLHISKLFASGRHLNLSIIFITQNLFEKGKFSRFIVLNSCYLVLFRNIVDNNQVKYLGGRFFPDNVKSFMEIYKDAVHDPFQYLLMFVYDIENGKK
jgi:hypothetical protein